MKRPTVSVVIPTLNAGPWLPRLLPALRSQEPAPPDEVVLVDSGSQDETLAYAEDDPLIRLISIDRFSHGGARNTGIRAAQGDVVVLMTQDAEPANTRWLARLLEALDESDVAAAYSRQIPRNDAPPMERFFLADRFPDRERDVRRHHGSEVPVYPETFFSNVSSAARRAMWLQFPFDESLLMSEDQQFARDVLQAGFAIVYEPSSVVLHSHRYSLMQTFKRYVDSVVAFQQLSEHHRTYASWKLGQRTIGRELAFIGARYPLWLPYYGGYQLAKAAGALVAHASSFLPRSWCARCSLHPAWWRDLTSEQ